MMEGTATMDYAETVQGTLNERAMLVSLTIRLWSGRKYDKKATAEVAQAHNVGAQVGRYNKRLLPQQAESLTAIQKIGTEARTYHYANTLPWSADGARILPSANYFEYAQEMRRFQTQFENAVPVFEAEYPDLKDQAKALLNGLYQEEDYPANVGGLFGFDVRVMPLPSAADFRVQLGDSITNAIKADIERQVSETMHAAMRDLWERLYHAVRHMAERLKDKDAVFRDSLVGNVRELCGLLPRLNVTGDEALESMRREVEEALIGQSPDVLRDNKVIRANVAQKADELAKRLSQYAGVF